MAQAINIGNGNWALTDGDGNILEYGSQADMLQRQKASQAEEVAATDRMYAEQGQETPSQMRARQMAEQGFQGLTGYEIGEGQVTMGLRGADHNILGREAGGENAYWIRDQASGKDVPAFRAPDGKYYRLDEYARQNPDWQSRTTGEIDEMTGQGRPVINFDLWSSRPSNDTFSGKDGLADLIKIGMMALPVIGGAMSGAAATAGATAGTASFEGMASFGDMLNGSLNGVFSEAFNMPGGFDSVLGGGETLTAGAGNVAGTGAPGAVAEGASSVSNMGITTNPQQFLVADAGTTMTDVSGGLLNSTPADATGAFDMYGSQATPGAPGTVFDAAQGPGLIDSALKFAKENPVVAVGAMQLGGGVLKGIGDANTAHEIIEAKGKSDKELLAERARLDEDAAAAKRRQVQSGSYYDARLPFKPGNGQLRRPDGTPVYLPGGLLNSRVQ